MAAKTFEFRIQNGSWQTRPCVRHKDWESYKPDVISMLDQGKAIDDILQALQRKGVNMKPHHLKRMLRMWGLSKRNIKAPERMVIYKSYHDRQRKGKKSAYRWADTKEEIKDTQVGRIINDRKNYPSNNDQLPSEYSSTVVEVYTPPPDPDPIAFIGSSEMGTRAVQCFGSTFPQEFDLSWTNERDIGNVFDSDGQVDSFGGLATVVPAPCQDRGTQLPVFEDILRASEQISRTNRGPRNCNKHHSQLDYHHPREEYKDDLDKWILDESYNAKSVIAEIEIFRSSTGMDLDDAYSIFEEKWKLSRGEDILPYDQYLAIIEETDARQQGTPAGRLLPRFLDWTPVFELFAKYYDLVETFAETQFFKVSFAMRVAHLPFLYKRYGALHYLTFRSLYSFQQILHFLTQDASELILISEAVAFSVIAAGLTRCFNGNRSYIYLDDLYERDKSIDRSYMRGRLSILFNATEIPDMVRRLHLLQHSVICFVQYLQERGPQNYFATVIEHDFVFDLMRLLKSGPTMAGLYTVLLGETLQQLGRAFLGINEPKKALQLLNQSCISLNRLEQSFGGHFGNFMYGWRYMAQANSQLRNYGESTKILDILLDWHMGVLGPEHRETKKTIKLATEIQYERGPVIYFTPEQNGVIELEYETENEEAEA